MTASRIRRKRSLNHLRTRRRRLERLEFDLLFRWFVGLGVDAVFTMALAACNLIGLPKLLGAVA